MGYRSDVSILIYGDDKDMVAFFAGERVKGNPKGITHHPLDEPTSEYHERMHFHTNEGDTLFEFNWFGIKWYDTYPEIAYWEQLMSIWEDGYKNTSLQLEFVRIGESTEDIVTAYYGGDCQYYLNVERTIYKSMGIKQEVEDEYRKEYDN
jgi:hypothetical protein